MIIAIDGPAGSGKSTTARAVSRRLGFFYLDTGAMYRAVALQFIRQGLEPTLESAADALANLQMEMVPGADGLTVRLSGEDVSDLIRTPEVTAMSSRVSQLEPVRARMVEEQRRMAQSESAEGRGVVLEGRDI
jgi:cytidylate kinase